MFSWVGRVRGYSKVGTEASIILLTKNGIRYVQEVLGAVLNQTAPDAHEVIVIDSGSTDGTWETALSFPILAHRILPEEFNHGETRNLGARLASPEAHYLVYLTQDATPLDNWLEGLLRPLRDDRQVAGAFSRHVPRPTCCPSMARLMRTEWEQIGTPDRVVKKLDDPDESGRNPAFFAHFSNTSSAIRRTVWEEHPFRSLEFAEDAEWAARVLRAGYTLIYEPASCVLHSHDYSLWQQFAQNVDHAQAMRKIHGLPKYEGAPTKRIVRRLSEQVLKDWRYILHMDISAFQKARWLVHAPFWQLATEAGAYAGARTGNFPAWLSRVVSRQARVGGR